MPQGQLSPGPLGTGPHRYGNPWSAPELPHQSGVPLHGSHAGSPRLTAPLSGDTPRNSRAWTEPEGAVARL